MYVVAIAKAKAWEDDYPVELGMIAYFNLKLIWMKLLIIWRFFRFWAMADGFVVDENMLRCMSNVYSIRSFWRMWHRSYNRWTIRYIVDPINRIQMLLELLDLTPLYRNHTIIFSISGTFISHSAAANTQYTIYGLYSRLLRYGMIYHSNC
jgi:D-alanyl-lipoteichoic acid acyltransferase DltB (MBOAT superfamily)